MRIGLDEVWSDFPQESRVIRDPSAMPTVVNIHEAKTHLSRFVEQAAAGREVIIAKAGRRIAKIVPLETKPQSKKFGSLAGRIKVPDDFNAPLDARTLAAFEGRS